MNDDEKDKRTIDKKKGKRETVESGEERAGTRRGGDDSCLSRTRRVARRGGSMWPCIRHPQLSTEVKLRLGGAHGLSSLHHDLTLAVVLGQPKSVRRLLVALLIIQSTR